MKRSNFFKRFMASVGDDMPDSDANWKQIYFNKDEAAKVVTSDNLTVTESSPNNYVFSSNERYPFLKFRFQGNRLKISGMLGENMPRGYRVFIDGDLYTANCYAKAPNSNNNIIYKNIHLQDGIHEVEIFGHHSPITNGYSLHIEDIAIDKEGKLLSDSIELGDILRSPEKDWSRLEFTNSKYYDGDITKDDFYEGYKVMLEKHKLSRLFTLKENAEFKFKFKGTQLRLTGPKQPGALDDHIVIIDGISETFSQAGSKGSNRYDNGSRLVYEKKGLDNKIHEVVLKSSKNNRGLEFSISGIDINNDGQLIPYNQNSLVLNIVPEKSTINLNETVIANLEINNITGIAAEDILIDYDQTKLEYVSMEEIPGIKIAYSNNDPAKGQLRLILASQGKANVVNAKKILLKIKFKGISAGDGLIDITKAKVTDGITLEKDLEDDQCGEATITIIAPKDVNRTGEFTLLDLGIDALHFGEDPKAPELSSYDTDVVINNAIDDADLLKIAQEMMANSNYALKN